MYEDHYQVFDDPFRFTPDEHKPFQHHSYLSGVAFLQHVLDHSRKVLILIYGVTGVGKSTLVNDILRRQDPNRVQAVTIKASNINSHGVIESISAAFALKEEGSEADLVQQLNEYLSEKSGQNQYSLFVIEDADELSGESLNRLGQLVRLIWDNRYKMKIFLIGSPVLDQLLYQSKNEILQKKIIIGWNQHGMGRNEIGGYVAHRIRNVGGTKLTFEDLVWSTLYDFSDGIPRRINRICNKLLLIGFIEKKLSFVNADIMDAVRQLDNEGLLEVKKSFATLHGMKGSSNEYKDDGHELEVMNFADGFTEPLLVEKFLVIDDEPDTPPDTDITMADTATEETIKRPEKKKARIEPGTRIPIDHSSRPAYIEPDKPGILATLMEWRLHIIVPILGVVGILLLYNSSILDITDHPVDPTKATADAEESLVGESKPAQPDKVESDDSLVATKAPLTPAPKVASEIEAGEIQTAKVEPKEISPAVTTDIVKDTTDETRVETTLDDDVDIDESGHVEELARIAREKALADAKAKEAIQPQVSAPPSKQTVVTPTYSIRQLKKMLLTGFWMRSGRPAVLLPSELNKCSESSKDIFCRATEIQKLADNKTITSRTGAMFHQFEGDGSFIVAYRRSASIESGKVSSPNDLREYKMSCRFVNNSQVECIKDGVQVQYVRRFKLESQ